MIYNGVMGISALRFDLDLPFLKVGSRVRLVDMPDQPEGMLLKQVTCLQDCIELGGIFLFAVNHPTKWRFAVGDSFLRELQVKNLNKVTTGLTRRFGDYGALQGCKFTANNQWSASFIATIYDEGENDTMPPTKKVGETLFPGGYFDPYYVEVPFFDPGEEVCALGVVSAASEGYGQSRHYVQTVTDGFTGWGPTLQSASPVGLSFLSTWIALNMTMGQFLVKNKELAIAACPEDVREYFSATFDQAVATFVGKDEVPYTGISTYWAGTALQTSVLQRSPAELSGADVSIPFYANVGKNDDLSATGMQPIVSGASGIGGYYAGTTKAMVDVRGGYGSVASAGIRPIMYQDYGFSTPGETIPPITGVIDAVKVGEIRDGHVLKRRLKDGLSFANTPSAIASMSEYILLLNGNGIVKTTASVDSLDATSVSSRATEVVNAAYRPESIYQRGSISTLTDGFNDHWDKLALANAEANH